MSRSRFGTGRRTTALLALSALVLVILGASVGFATDPDAGGEACVGCAGCENGECGAEDNLLASHHHCCATCCMSHAPLALPAAQPYTAPAIAEPMLTCLPTAATGRTSETPYRPPRI